MQSGSVVGTQWFIFKKYIYVYWYIYFFVKVAYSFECDCVGTIVCIIMTDPLLLYGTRNWAKDC